MKLILKILKEKDPDFKIEDIHCINQLDDTHWTRFLDILTSHPTVKCLNLTYNGLDSLEVTRFKQLFDIIASHKKLTSLILDYIRLDRLDGTRWKYLCNAIASNRSLSSLRLSQTFLYNLDSNLWFFNYSRIKQLFNVIGSNSSLTSLNLSHNSLSSLNASLWTHFCKALVAKSGLSHLCLWGNFLGQLDAPLWKEFCDVIAVNHSLTTVYLEGNSIDYNRDDARWRQLKNAIAANPYIVGIGKYFYMESQRLISMQKSLDARKHGMHLAAAHSLSKINLDPIAPDKPARVISSDIAKMILERYDNPESLNKQVVQEVIMHNKKIQEALEQSYEKDENRPKKRKFY